MLNCEYCDYFKKVHEVAGKSESKNSSFCKFTDYVFAVPETESDMEYPCKDISYQDYLNRRIVCEETSKIKGNDWKVLYKNKHPVPERKRSAIAV